MLVGEGGGAAALIPHASSRTGLHHEISRDAEVISSIGVALALVRDVVERVIPNPQPEDLKRIRREAFEAVVKLGAAPDGVEVTIEVDQNTHRVRATAMGDLILKDDAGRFHLLDMIDGVVRPLADSEPELWAVLTDRRTRKVLLSTFIVVPACRSRVALPLLAPLVSAPASRVIAPPLPA